MKHWNWQDSSRAMNRYRSSTACWTRYTANRSRRAGENQWLGGRDSNPDTQIQSFLQAQADQQNQQLSSADCGGVRPNPQYSRNKEQQASYRVNGFDSEEDTLP